jgi:hypothetical protein
MDLLLYNTRLTHHLGCLKFLLKQGLELRGHDKSEESSNRGNFIELLKCLADGIEEVSNLVVQY